MYLKHFNLSEAPFSIAPNPRYLYLSQRHQEALAHLLYGIHGDGGFVLLTGDIGAGKTTVCRCLLEQIPDNCDVAYIFNPKLSVTELLSTICHEFGIDCPAGNTSIKIFVDAINDHLLAAHAAGRNSVLIIDEAQNLAPDVLEQMRLLTNLETDQRKLLQIILIGQPELAEILDHPGLRQLAQRIVARYHLDALDKAEVAAYVQHRLAVGGTQRPLIPAPLAGLLHRLSGGVPRIINVLCDRALLGAFTQGKDKVDRAMLLQAAREVLPPSSIGRRSSTRHFRNGWGWPQTLATSALLLIGVAMTYAYPYWRTQADSATANTTHTFSMTQTFATPTMPVVPVVPIKPIKMVTPVKPVASIKPVTPVTSDTPVTDATDAPAAPPPPLPTQDKPEEN